MTETFFERPILNSPYEPPHRHWDLDADGQPTNRIEGEGIEAVAHHAAAASLASRVPLAETS